MTTQKDTHTLRVFDGGNAQLCLLSLSSLTVPGCDAPKVTFFIGADRDGPSVMLDLIVTAYEIIDPPYSVRMKAIRESERHFLSPLAQISRASNEFVFTNYDTRSRKGCVQIPHAHLEKIVNLLKG